MKFALEAGKETIEIAASLGALGTPVGGADLLDRGVATALAPLDERGLSACQVGFFEYNPLRPDPGIRERLLRLVDDAGAVAPIVFSGGSYQANPFGPVDRRNRSAEAMDDLARELAPVVEAAEAAGATLSIEPYLKSCIGSPERFLELKERIPSPALKVNIDVTSLYGSDELIDPDAFCERACRMLSPHCGLVHIKEIALDDAFHLRAGLVPLGEGPTNWEIVLRHLEVPADRWILLEHVDGPDAARAGAEILMAAARRTGAEIQTGKRVPG